MKKDRALWAGFIKSAELFPDRPAVVAEGKTLTYKELREKACRIAATIQGHQHASATPLSAVFAYRSPTAFAGVLGSLLAGNGYVPLNRTFPVDRTQAMFARSECNSIIVDAGSLPQLDKLLEESPKALLILLPDVENVESLRKQWPRHAFAGSNDLAVSSNWREPEVRTNSIAYLLFTSGSTGIPKGVMVTQRNVTAFLDYMVERYEITEKDRLSQMFDMTFDLSVFDMFVAWECGAWLCCPSQKALIKPGNFIQDMELTVWFSVPSTAIFMKQFGMLKAGRYPTLRLSLFCGEPLPVASASAWLDAAPNSILENLYGPTELTIACTLYRERAEVFFLAGANVADLSANVGGQPLTEYFSQLIPPAMFIRYAFRERCWHPNQHHATLIIDDPLLRKDYGFLNYECLLALMDKYNFHTCIAFIPYNWRRNSPGITRMFRERPDRLSICFHGNDHTAAEFASKDSGLLNAMLTAAEERMDVHQKESGIRCNHVMVFPQGNFSRDAMAALKAHNFSAAVNSGPYPRGENPGLTLSEFVEPAVLKYGGFPLFLRKYPREIALQDIAFNLFFGKPVLIVEHHEIFKDPESLTQLVSCINALAPEIRWSNLRAAVENSHLQRWTTDGILEIRAYANGGKIENASKNVLRCSVEWPGQSEIPVEKVLLDGMPWHDARTDDKGIRLSFDVSPGGSREFSIVYQNNIGLSDANRRVPWKTKVFFRRRLSELRDNHLSKSPQLLSIAKVLQRTLFKSSTS